MARFLLLLPALILIAGTVFPDLTAFAQNNTNPGGNQGNTNPGGNQGNTNPGGNQGNTNPDTGSGGGLVNPLNSISSLPELLEAILGAIVDIGSIILVLALVYVGFLFVVAQGNEEKLRNAKSALLWTLVGGLVLLGAAAIGAVIESTVGTL